MPNVRYGPSYRKKERVVQRHTPSAFPSVKIEGPRRKGEASLETK
ncbi:hypothetical protein Q7C20_20545 [Pseudomonas sp. AMR01]